MMFKYLKSKISKIARRTKDSERLSVQKYFESDEKYIIFNTDFTVEEHSEFMLKNNIESLEIRFKESEKKDEIYYNLNSYSKLNFVKKLTIDVLKFNFTGLSLFRNLEKLSIIESSKNPIDFKGLVNLKEIYFYFRKKISNFEDLINMETVGITNLNNQDLSFLKKCNKLKSLIIARGTCTSLDGLNCSKLEHIDLWSFNKLKDFSVLKNSNNLEKALFDNCKNIYDLKFLLKNKKLKHLSIRDCGEIDSLGFLSKLEKLKFINFYGKTIVLDGDFSKLKDKCLNFINKKHYSNKKNEFPLKRDVYVEKITL